MGAIREEGDEEGEEEEEDENEEEDGVCVCVEEEVTGVDGGCVGGEWGKVESLFCV